MNAIQPGKMLASATACRRCQPTVSTARYPSDVTMFNTSDLNTGPNPAVRAAVVAPAELGCVPVEAGPAPGPAPGPVPVRLAGVATTVLADDAAEEPDCWVPGVLLPHPAARGKTIAASPAVIALRRELIPGMVAGARARHNPAIVRGTGPGPLTGTVVTCRPGQRRGDRRYDPAMTPTGGPRQPLQEISGVGARRRPGSSRLARGWSW